MDENENAERPPMTEADEEAEVVSRAEAGDEAAEVAMEEAGGPPSSADADEPMGEPQAEVDREAEPTPPDDVVDVPTEEATTYEAEAEEAMPEAAIEAAVEEEAAPVAVSPFDGPGDWYVVHTYAGYENKVKTNLQTRISSMQMEEKIFDVVIPMEDVMEIKGGKKQVVQRKVFPGYLLVKMIYDNDSWYVVRNTPGVTGFVASGTGSKPTPLSRREVEKILAVKEETQVKPAFRLEFEEGDVVRITMGPFADFTGTIAEINVEQSKLKVLVNIFDRETPVELAFDQVAKA
jgi:transcription termination/antitermination protein NusG